MAATSTTDRLRDAAYAYARAGWNVIPLHSIRRGKCTCNRDNCTSPGKHPRTENGLHEATTEPGAIGWWWNRWPGANVGIVTGTVSSIVVVDIDPDKGGETTWEALVRERGDTPTLTSLTGGDGLHHIYQHPGNIELRNTASKLGPGVDTRGDGGYIVAPPSLHLTGQRYEWLDPDQPIAPLPDWIRDAIEKIPVPTAGIAPPRDYEPSSGTTPYARVALDRQADDVAAAPEGQRNHTLNQAAFRLGQLIAGGQVDEQTVELELTAAAQRAGIGGTEVANTIRSGLAAGAREPQYPDPNRASIASRGAATTSTNIDSRTSIASANVRSEPSAPNESAEKLGPTDDHVDAPDGEPPGPPVLEGHDDEDDPDGDINETDLGNARRLIRRHGHELRYATHLRRWLRWDGQRWQQDEDGFVDRCMHATAQSISMEAAELPDADDRKRRFAWSFKSEAARALDNAMAVASNLRGTPITATQLDADPWLLNVRNGTVDLRTGELRPHTQTDLLTKLAPVDYNPNAQDDRWDAYLASALPDPELVDWVQRAVGYTLTGDTTEEVLFFVHGPTRAGKSTFLEAIKAALGDYARNADFETFLDRDHGGTARGDIARLAGARLVTSNEVDEGRRLAEGLVKTLTGGDTITARFLYRDEFEYMPQFKLWLAANHKPKVRHGDDAIWRRIRLLPFVHPPAVPDPTLKAHLATGARAAILAWAVRGCIAWQQRGLSTVAAVREATEAYRAEMDPLGEFFEDHCVFDGDDPNCWVLAADLRKSYEEWAAEQGTKRTLSNQTFRQLLEERGCENGKRRIGGKQHRVWNGLRLLGDFENPESLPGMASHASREHGRDEQDAISHSSSIRAGAGEDYSETPSHVSRPSHPAETRETPLSGTSAETAAIGIEFEGNYSPCAGCGTAIPVDATTKSRGFKVYCQSCEPF